MILGITTCYAQYDPSFSHYFDMEPSFNPGAVGKQAKINVNIDYALDMAGFEHNPRTMYAGADLPFYALKNYHGVGVQFMNDQIGLFTHQKLALQYAFKKRLFKGMLSAGIQAGFLSESFDGSKVDLGESNDPAFSTSQIDGNGLDLGFGLYYSYNIKLRNPFLSIKPSTLVRYDGVTWRGDVSCRMVYTHEKKMMYGGVSYSPTNSVTFLVGGMFHGVVLGYSYEMYTSAISPGNGSHELFVGYQTDINLVKKGRNKHKSVRIL